jgi:lysophospholipase L1-like esterase
MLRILTCLLFVWAVSPSTRADDFALRDGDKLVFLGDSITAARGYSKLVEQYTLLRYPDRKVRFLNAGQGGDTAYGCLQRLDRDVIDQGATVVTVAFGINDIGWGTKADDEHRNRYLEGIRGIVERCQRRGIRVFICSPAITAESPDTAEKEYLQRMADDGMALARSLGASTIDLSRGMREIQRRVLQSNAGEKDVAKHTRMHATDGVHLNELGQLAMGFAMIRGLGGPKEVSLAHVDAAAGKLVRADACAVTDLQATPTAVSFRRLDAGLPWTFGILGALQYRWIPLPETLNGYRLRVEGLAPGRYEVRVEGRAIGRYSADLLAKGENISTATTNGWEPGGAWEAQADALRDLIDARDKLWAADVLRRKFDGTNPAAAALDREHEAMDARLMDLERAVVKPYAYRFEIVRLPDEPKR